MGPTATSTNTPQTGYSASHALPNEVALCVTERTGLAGRSQRGRLYLGGIPLNATDGVDLNRLESAHIGTANSAAASFLAAMISDDVTPVVTSYFHDKAPRALAQNTEIVSMFVNGRLDSQRRRMPVV